MALTTFARGPWRDQRGRLVRNADRPFREWPWHERAIEKMYRWTHGGQIRTLVIRAEDR